MRKRSQMQAWGCEIPGARLNDEITLYQWLRNHDGQQVFGTQSAIIKLTTPLFKQYIFPRLRPEYRRACRTLAAFLEYWPNATHLRLFSGEGIWKWTFSGVGTREYLAPHGDQDFWAVEVKSFDNIDARTWGIAADGDAYPPTMYENFKGTRP
jgi:hypothetical protein